MPELTVTSVVAGGEGLGREDSGRVVFVRGGLPGERLEVRFTEERRDFARATVDRVVAASPDRVRPPCRFAESGCGGCDWQHAAVTAQATLKRDIVVDALRRIARIESPPVDDTVALSAAGYRTTVRVAVDPDGRPAFRKAASHDLVPVDDCLVAHPAIAAMLADSRWPGAREATLRVGARTGEVLVDVRPRPHDAGEVTHFHEEVDGRRFQISAGSFFQIRPDGADALVALVAGALSGHSVGSVADLYCGVGLFAGTLHDRGFNVRVAVEGSRTSVVDARVNLAGVCDVVEAEVGKWAGVPVDAVVADPSRRGLLAEGVEAVRRCGARVVVLVSCDAAALGRDAKLLAGAGFRLDRAVPVDLFPHTPHVEVVSTFVHL